MQRKKDEKPAHPAQGAATATFTVFFPSFENHHCELERERITPSYPGRQWKSVDWLKTVKKIKQFSNTSL